MGSLCFSHSIGFVDTHGFGPLRANSFAGNGAVCLLSCGFPSFPLLGRRVCGRVGVGMVCDDRMKCWSSVGSESIENAHLDRKGHSGVRKRYSLKLRARLRLLLYRLKRVSVRAIVNDFGMFLKKNIRILVLTSVVSISLGMCFTFLKMTATVPPKLVLYSDLVMNLQSGSVTNVLFEEGSRNIYFNTKGQDVEVLHMVQERLSSGNAENVDLADGTISKDVAAMDEDCSLSENAENVDVADGTTSNDVAYASPAKGVSFFRRSLKSKTAAPQWQYSTRKINHDEKFLLSLMREKGTIYCSAPQSMLSSMRNILITVLTVWIPLAPIMWLMYRQLSVGNSPARKRKSSKQMVSFDDVEGVDSAKVELMEIVMCLQGSINYSKLGAKLPRGVLLVGPPGTGKTLLARAVAGEAGVPFFSVSASEFVELFVGRGASRIRDLFNSARKSAPSIVFIDELDAVGGKRGRSFNDERDQTLNQLLTEMDGFDSETKVIVIAATNRPDALDPALIRPGRFSRKVLVGEPDEVGRRKILAVHFREVPLEEDEQLICNLVASLTPGFVGADLANIVNEAALLAARQGHESVTREDVMEAIERAKFGIDNRRPTMNTISKELGKLFPWMPSLTGKTDVRSSEGEEGLLGYRALS
ncbi:putative inactive ATP-dependent zinc metalloprotease FTSHI 3, chloroplastic [Drosera capensis]